MKHNWWLNKTCFIILINHPQLSLSTIFYIYLYFYLSRPPDEYVANKSHQFHALNVANLSLFLQLPCTSNGKKTKLGA